MILRQIHLSPVAMTCTSNCFVGDIYVSRSLNKLRRSTLLTRGAGIAWHSLTPWQNRESISAQVTG
jgi:hypothetical protein